MIAQSRCFLDFGVEFYVVSSFTGQQYKLINSYTMELQTIQS